MQLCNLTYILVIAVQIMFEESTYTTSEGGQVTINVRKIGEAGSSVNVTLSTESGTAIG